jgi:hypothetical protein
VLLEILITNPSLDAPITLAPRAGPWPRAVRVKATGPSGEAEAWPFELAAEPPSAAITLPAGASTHFFVLLPERATIGLAPGRYTITAEIEIRDSVAWNGLVRTSVPLEVQPDGPPNADQQLEVAVLRATVYLMRRQHAEAKGVLQAYLAKTPDAIPALHMMAEVLDDEGDTSRAYLYAARALYVYGEANAKPVPGEKPPAQLLLLRRRLWAKLPAAPPQTAVPAPIAAPGSSPTAPMPALPPTGPDSGAAVRGAPVTPIAPKPASPPSQPAAAPPRTTDPAAAAPPASEKSPMDDYTETVKKGDDLFAAGDYFSAVLAYERAWRIAYNNKLKTDAKALEERVTRARKARDQEKR